MCAFPEQAIRYATESRGWVIDPNHSEWTAYWDLMMMTLLTIVLFLTPYEVAFLAPSVGVLFAINRVLDLIFICDLVMQFFLAYQNGPEKGSTWVKSLPMIRKRYMKGWFAVDLLSVLPFWSIGMVINAGQDDGAGADESGGGGGAESILRIVRAVRLLRLIKLGKVLGMSRILKRYEAHMDVTYALLSLIKMVFSIVAWSHLQACVWGMIPTLEAEGTVTWLTDLAESQGTTVVDLDPGLKYSAALYWSVMTLTSIGYVASAPPQPSLSPPSALPTALPQLSRSPPPCTLTLNSYCLLQVRLDAAAAVECRRDDPVHLPDGDLVRPLGLHHGPDVRHRRLHGPRLGQLPPHHGRAEQFHARARHREEAARPVSVHAAHARGVLHIVHPASPSCIVQTYIPHPTSFLSPLTGCASTSTTAARCTVSAATPRSSSACRPCCAASWRSRPTGRGSGESGTSTPMSSTPRAAR